MGLHRTIRIVAAAAAWAMSLASTHAAAMQPKIDPVHLEYFVDGLSRQAMTEGHIAGLTVAIVDANGPLLLKGYGIAGHGRQVDAETMFRVGSISKTVTWIAIMQLVERGKLRLDDPINAHLPPALQIPDEGFKRPIRIWHLMTHTAGFEFTTLGDIALDGAKTQNLSAYLSSHRVHRVREPGLIVAYSNYVAGLAGAVVEHESGMSFVDYAERNILRPLGMTSATFREPYPQSLMREGLPAPLPAAAAARVSSGFRFRDGAFQEQTWEFFQHLAPAGAMSASARDMAAYMRALLVPPLFEQDHVLSAKTALALREPLFRNDPRLGANRHGFWEIPVAFGAPAFGHNGDMAFQDASMGIYPGYGIAIFVAQNTGGISLGPNRFVATAPRRILDEFFGAHEAARVATSRLASARFAGCYSPLRRPSFRTERALFAFAAVECLQATPNGDLLSEGDALRYVPIGGGVYATHDLTHRIAFRMESGRMRQFDFDGSSASERIGILDQPALLGVFAGLAFVMAAYRTLSGVARAVSGRETAGLAIIDVTALLWLMAMAATGFAIAPWLRDETNALFFYPGVLFPVGCSLLLAAALTTFGAISALVLVRPNSWSWPRWIAAGTALAIFAGFALLLQRFGFLGFSGW